MTSGLEREWAYSGRKGRDGKSKKIDKASKKGKSEKLRDAVEHGEVNG